MLGILKNKVFLGIIGVIAIGIVSFAIFSNGNGSEIIAVKRADVIQNVMATGKTKAQNDVNLGFDKTGRVTAVYFDVGDKVSAGAVIAKIDSSDILADLAKQRAILAEEEAKQGNSGEELVSAIREAYTAADNAIRNKVDQFFNQPRENPNFEVKFSDGNFVHYFNVPSDTVINLNNGRRLMEEILTKWQYELFLINTSNVKSFAEEAVFRMNQVSSFLNDMSLAVNSFTPDDYSYETTVAGYKTAIDTARTNVDTERAALISAKESFSAESGGTSSGQARVDQIKAAILSLEASLSKTNIVAPFSGTLTKQDAKPGSIATAGTELVSLISESDMYIEANISEINIGKIAIGNPVEIDFDAFPGEVFEGSIIYIEPGETIIDGVVNYKTRVAFESFDSKIKSGLTTNLKIETAKKENVLAIPVYTIYQGENGSFVKKGLPNNTTETPVETGLTGSDGMIEIISGLAEGDRVVFTK